jgi:NADH-quinone oxidoreductase subunit N
VNNFDQLVRSVMQDAVGVSLPAFRPELAICATILAVLLARMLWPRWTHSAYYVTFVGLLAAIFFVLYPWHWQSGRVPDPSPIFTGTLVYDSFSIVMRLGLLLFALLFTTFTQISGEKPDNRPGDESTDPAVRSRESFLLGWDEMTEFYVLMLGALLGMCLMISANHVLIVMMGVEMASVPCYVLAGMKRSSSKSSEAALKYAVFGAGAAGVMLYGLSLLSGALGSAHLPTMAARLAELLQSGAGADKTTVLVLGGLMLAVGVAFKLSAVPFHFWAPDVFEGAMAEVGAFLSVASKAAALGLLVRLASDFSFSNNPAAMESLAPVRHYIVMLIALLAAVTCTFGNLAAYGQTNMKRLLAYSTIAHAGYMMMPVAAAVALVGQKPAEAQAAVAALVLYLGIYLFMNLAAFAFVAFVRNAIGSEEIADYGGMIHASPGLTVCMAVVLFSLVGLPPLAGFQGKLFIFYSLVEAKLWPLLFIGILNTVLSLFYYLRVVKVMTLSPQPLHRASPMIPLGSLIGIYFFLFTLPLVALFFVPGRLLNWALAAASGLF